MTRLYVYALLGAPPERSPGRGVRAEPIRIAGVGRLFAAVGAMPNAPAVAPRTLRAHDMVVRRLARATGALLPVRFGTLVDGPRELDRLLAPRAAALTAALALVDGREQMTLRVFAAARRRARRDPTPRGPGRELGRNAGGLDRDGLRRAAPRERLGPGARYLAARVLTARNARRVPEIAWLRPALHPFVAAELVERYDAPPLVASVHHLIARGNGGAYLTALASAATRGHDVRVLPSGPWPPYAFTPDSLVP